MKIIILKISVILACIGNCIETKDSDSFTEDDFTAIDALGNFTEVKCFTFVNDNKEMIRKEIKHFSKSNFYSSVISTKDLIETIEDSRKQARFLHRKTMIVTKENFNLTELLGKVITPHFFIWVVFAHSVDKFENFYIPINTDMYVVDSKSNEIVVNHVYHSKQNLNLTFTRVGAWKKGEKQPKIKPHAIDFHGIKMNMIGFRDEETCKLLKKEEILDKLECYHKEIVEILSSKLNFKMVGRLVQNREYPYNFPNGTLSELFTSVHKREVELSTASYIITADRLQNMDFVWPTFTVSTRMYMRKNEQINSWSLFQRPFSSDLWIMIIVWMLVTSFLLAINQRFHGNDPPFFIFEVYKFFLEILQLFFYQSIENVSKWCSDRIIYVFGGIILIVLYYGYNAQLTSSLTVVITRYPFWDLSGFFRAKRYKIITLRRGFHQYIIQTYFQMYAKERDIKSSDYMLGDNDLPLTPDEGIFKLCENEDLVFVDFRENIIQHELPCQLKEIPTAIQEHPVGIGLPKNSPYKEYLNRELMLLHSIGIIQRMRRNILLYVEMEDKEAKEGDYVPVTQSQVVSLYAYLTIGIAISAVICILEIIWNAVTTRSKKWKNAKKKSRHRKISTHWRWKQRVSYPELIY